MRLLYSSNAFWAKSGYGVQGMSLLPRLAELETIKGRENIAQFAWYGLQGGIHNVDGFTVYPAGMEAYGTDIIGLHSKHFNADVVVTLIDVWVQNGTGDKVKPALWLPWFPIDHHDAPPRVLEALATAHLPLTYSKFGHECVKKHGIDNRYIPHGLEPSIYRIIDDQEQLDNYKKQYFRHDGHITTMVAANKGRDPDRKAFQWQLRAWAEFSRDKEDARLYLHTEPTPLYDGLNLVELCHKLGIAEKTIFPNRYDYFLGLPAEQMAFIYNTSNVLMEASLGEGFGIPIIEAQACGTPVITQNFTAMPELIRYGTILEPKEYIYTQLDAFMAIPDVDAIIDALNENYTEWLDNDKQRDMEAAIASQDAIHEEFSWDVIVEKYWKPLFIELDTHVKTIKETPSETAESSGVKKVQPKNNTQKKNKVSPKKKK